MTRPPDFICIGAQKSGTTWLYEQLRRHPLVHIAAKEMDVFYKDLSIDAFAGAAAEQLVGDISPVYGAAPGVAAKIRAVCPGAKIIMLIRDPVARAWSQYKMAARLGNIPHGTTFLDAFFNDCRWLQRRGRYAEIINDFAAFRSRLLVTDFERIAKEPLGIIVDVCKFIGVEPLTDDSAIHTVFAAGRDGRTLPETDAEQIANYYRPHNARLLDMLPWRPSWIDR